MRGVWIVLPLEEGGWGGKRRKAAEMVEENRVLVMHSVWVGRFFGGLDIGVGIKCMFEAFGEGVRVKW